MTDNVDTEKMAWYVLRVQSGREGTISEALRRRIKAKGLENSIGQVLVPTEKVYEIKGGTKRVSERKLYPGYIYIQMVINDDSWFLVKETPGVGDFVGSPNKPTAMPVGEIEKVLRESREEEDQPKIRISFKPGDRVKVKEGTFENFDGVVEDILAEKGIVRVGLTIFGRATPVELEYWKLESL